jgi:hypothetical protein
VRFFEPEDLRLWLEHNIPRAENQQFIVESADLLSAPVGGVLWILAREAGRRVTIVARLEILGQGESEDGSAFEISGCGEVLRRPPPIHVSTHLLSIEVSLADGRGKIVRLDSPAIVRLLENAFHDAACLEQD